MTMLQTIANDPIVAAAILARDDWSNYIYLLLIVLSGLGALANKAIERFGGKKPGADQTPRERPKRKYPPIVMRDRTPRFGPQPPPRPVPPPTVARTFQTPRPAPKPVRPTARPLPSRRPPATPPSHRQPARPPPHLKHRHAAHEDLPSEVAELVAGRAATKKKTATRRKKAPSQRIERDALSVSHDTAASAHTEGHLPHHAVLGLTNPDELRRAILLREILGPPVALRDEDPWSV